MATQALVIAPAEAPRPYALAVEDDSFERFRLMALLENMGFEVVCVEDGAQALAELAVRIPDVLVTDWQLPGISGLEICRSLRRLDPAERPFTVLATARDEISDLVEGLEAGADDFVTKPYRPNELAARIRAGQRLRAMRVEMGSRTALLEQALRFQRQSTRSLDLDLQAASLLQKRWIERSMEPIAGVVSAFLFRPTRRIGGDLFGMCRVSEQKIGFFHIDAISHGVAAAIQAVSIGIAVQSAVSSTVGDAAQCLRDLNTRSFHDEPELACSVLIGWLRLDTGEGCFSQAGFPHPFIVDSTGAVSQLGSGGLPIGSLPNAHYLTTQFTLNDDERLVFHSDGVTDCVNPASEVYGDAALRAALGRHRATPIDEWIRRFGQALDTWRGPAQVEDDVSLMALQLDRV